MGAVLNSDVSNALGNSNGAPAAMLCPKRERRLLEELADIKRTLARALARETGFIFVEDNEGHREVSQIIAEVYRNRGLVDSALKPFFQRYFDLRAELVLANMRLVAYVAKQYRNRGMAYSDLLQEGFRGLLEAIDRFDLARQTRLSTYATWWIRQAIQSAVASAAYPVHLSPRHLRQLARSQKEHDSEVAQYPGRYSAATESIERIHAATRPPVSLSDARFTPIQTLSETETVLAADIDLSEAIRSWMVSLRPRERQVLSYRFGLGGSPRLSLSQVGKVLDVSKERVRQIETAALKVLRANASRDKFNQA
jgi:RNA polymerase sigma factor (sigma-70 family)